MSESLQNLRIVFLGTSDFAVSCLKVLVEEGFLIVGVVTNPDKRVGRGQKLSVSPVKEYALEAELPMLQPTHFTAKDFLSNLQSWNACLQIVIAFKILPKEVWGMPPLGTINLHASYLPQYRGAAPINRAIVNGESETGVTTMLLADGVDTGPILFREKVPIAEEDTAGTLQKTLEKKGATLLIKTIHAIARKKATPIPHKELISASQTLKKAPKILRYHCQINWQDTAENIYNHIRGFSPNPTAWTCLQSKNNIVFRLKIFTASKIIQSHNLQPKSIVSDNKTYIRIAVKNGFIQIESLQMEGKKRQLVKNFLNGCDISLYILK